MAIKFEKIQPGMRLWERRRAGWRSRLGGGGKWDTWPVDVISVNAKDRNAVVRWNGNPAQVYGQRMLERLHLHEYPKARAAASTREEAEK